MIIWTDFSSILAHPRDWRTDRQTDGKMDGRTDRILIARPRLLLMQRDKMSFRVTANCIIVPWPLLHYCQHSFFIPRHSIGVARILSGGALFLAKKVFLVDKDRLNIPPNLTRPGKTVLKTDSCSGWGCTSCPVGALTHFPCKLRPKIFFHRPGGAGAPTAPLATPMRHSPL